jgi:hypothetical protein
MREIPLGCSFWPSNAGEVSPDEVVRMYMDGFSGAWKDEQARRVWQANVTADGMYAHANDACRMFGLTGTGAGKLWLLFPHIEELFPGALPGPPQARGDCVSRSSSNAALASLCAEIIYGKPDEITGKVEGAPEVPPAGIANGVLSSEYLYWWRGYDGDGWDCATAADMITKNGMLLRKQYPELGLDLTKYSGNLAGKYGRTRPPAAIMQEGQIHPVRTTTECSTYTEVLDLIANGFGISSCGSEGFENSRNDDGVSRRSGSWAHAMAYLGADDRADTRQKYGEGLILVCNSWGTWNSGPKRIRNTSIDIPDGCFWAKWSDVRNRHCIAYASVAGWPRKKLPDYGFSVLG